MGNQEKTTGNDRTQRLFGYRNGTRIFFQTLKQVTENFWEARLFREDDREEMLEIIKEGNWGSEYVSVAEANTDFFPYSVKGFDSDLDRRIYENNQKAIKMIKDSIPKSKPTAAALMLERTEKSQYNRILKAIRKEADAGKRYYGKVRLSDYTVELLTAEGFKLTLVANNNFVAYEIRW